MKDKLNVTIFGTCVTREMFNDVRLQQIFSIDLYIFKVCPLALFQKSLNVPEQKIKKIPLEDFTIRSLTYDINKTAIKEMESKKSEYFIFDLFNLKDEIYQIAFNGKKIYISTDGFWYTQNKVKKSLQEQNVNIEIKEMPNIDKFDQKEICLGLKMFADWINQNYKNVIIVSPKITKQFFDKSENLSNFEDSENEKFNTIQKEIDKWTKFMIQNLPNAKVLNWDDNFISRFFLPDYLSARKYPTPVHLISENYNRLGSRLLNLLNINADEYYNKCLPAMPFETERIKNWFYSEQNFNNQLYKRALCSINGYTNFLKTLKHHLIVFCIHADGQNLIKFWRNRYSLGLDFKINFRDSYIGILDTKNNFKYENSSQKAINYNYNSNNCSVYVESHGFYAQNYSSILFNNTEYSKQKRGFNIFVLDLNSNEIVDSANCDTCLDKYLIVNSDMLSKFSEK